MKKNKKKKKNFFKWFFTSTDKGTTNVEEYSNLYDLVERLQYRVEGLENEHMLLIRDYNDLIREVASMRSGELDKS